MTKRGSRWFFFQNFFDDILILLPIIEAVCLLADERRREGWEGGCQPSPCQPAPKTNNFFPVIGVRLDKDQDDIGGKKDENVVTKCNYQKKTKLGEFVSLVG